AVRAGAAGVGVRRGRGVRGLRRDRHGRGDQQPARAARPAAPAAAPGGGGGHAVLGRHRRARARPAGLADPRVRPRGGVRGARRTGGDDLVAGGSAGLDPGAEGAVRSDGRLRWYPVRPPEGEERVWNGPRCSTSTAPWWTPTTCM